MHSPLTPTSLELWLPTEIAETDLIGPVIDKRQQEVRRKSKHFLNLCLPLPDRILILDLFTPHGHILSLQIVSHMLKGRGGCIALAVFTMSEIEI